MSKHAAPTVASRTVVRTRTTGQSVVRLVKQILLGSAVLGIAFLGLGAYASTHLPAPTTAVPAPAPAPASTATYPDDPASLTPAQVHTMARTTTTTTTGGIVSVVSRPAYVPGDPQTVTVEVPMSKSGVPAHLRTYHLVPDYVVPAHVIKAHCIKTGARAGTCYPEHTTPAHLTAAHYVL